VVVYADHGTCLKRLMMRDGVNEDQAGKAMECQMDLSEKALRADHVIDNSGSMVDTQSQVEQFAFLLQNNGD
jgi:dephospho-CoA kinase